MLTAPVPSLYALTQKTYITQSGSEVITLLRVPSSNSTYDFVQNWEQNSAVLKTCLREILLQPLFTKKFKNDDDDDDDA